MSNLNIVETSADINTDDIIEFENKFKITIPPPLKDHYLKHNGGRPDVFKLYFVPKLKTPIECTEITINGFYPIKHRTRPTEKTLEEMYDLYISKNDFDPKKFMPFAYDVSGYPLLIDLENYGIYLLNRDEEDADNNDTIEFVALSLNDFIENLITPESYEN